MISVAADLTLDKSILNEAGSGNDVTTGVAMHAWSTSGSSRRYQSDGFAACSGRIARPSAGPAGGKARAFGQFVAENIASGSIPFRTG